MSKISRKPRDKTFKTLGDHQKYLSRITKTFYYGKLPKTDRLSFPVTEWAAELFSESQQGRSLNRLHHDNAAEISRNACVSPCSLVLAVLYLERLKKLNPEYLQKTAPSDLFLVSLMVSCKFLYDDGESDEVFMDEWAASAGISSNQLVQLERGFLSAIDWEVYVNELTFWKKLTEIETTLARRQGVSRGSFTYTELYNLLALFEVNNLVMCFSAVFVVLAVSYTAALLTVAGSIYITSHIPGTCIQPKKTDNQPNNTLSIIQGSLQPQLDVIETEIPLNIDELETDYSSKSDVKAVNVIKTGIFLASIEGLLKPFCNNSNGTDIETSRNVQNVTWDWWNVPAMKWLSKTSQLVDKLELPRFDFGLFMYFLETCVSKVKYLELEDQIHKATKTRIQDQMENSWHKEWIDTINYGLYGGKFHYYIQNIKS